MKGLKSRFYTASNLSKRRQLPSANTDLTNPPFTSDPGQDTYTL